MVRAGPEEDLSPQAPAGYLLPWRSGVEGARSTTISRIALLMQVFLFARGNYSKVLVTKLIPYATSVTESITPC